MFQKFTQSAFNTTARTEGRGLGFVSTSLGGGGGGGGGGDPGAEFIRKKCWKLLD